MSTEGPEDDAPESRRWLAFPRGRSETDEAEERLSERLAQQFAQQWALIREERRSEPAPIRGGTSNFDRAQVPWGVDLAAAWAWRFLVIAGAGTLLYWVAAQLAVVTVPVTIALLLAALGSPAVRAAGRVGVPSKVSAAVVLVGLLGVVGALLTFVGRQIVEGFTDLADQVVAGLGEIRAWLRDGPLNASDSQINEALLRVQESITTRTRDGEAINQVTEIGTALTSVVAGFFILLFATYFFLADGNRIWSWVVRLMPRVARERIDTSGRVAWVSLAQFVRATVVVALVDAIGIMIVARILGLPFVLAIGVLVFLGAFVPMIGATIAGAVAVLVALVDQGPWTAVLMFGGVILVQQIEGNVLQPFLMGRFVSVHPLGVLIAIACGVLVAGVAGALFAVPAVAALNAVVQHIAAHTDPPGDPPDESGDPPAGDDPSSTSGTKETPDAF